MRLMKSEQCDLQTIMMVAMCAVINAYTPPLAPARNMCGLTIDVPMRQKKSGNGFVANDRNW